MLEIIRVPSIFIGMFMQGRGFEMRTAHLLDKACRIKAGILGLKVSIKQTKGSIQHGFAGWVTRAGGNEGFFLVRRVYAT